MILKKRNCEQCNAEFVYFPADYFAPVKKKIFCPRCRCIPGRHRFTLVKRAVVCLDCFLLRIPLAVAVRRETLKRKRDKGLTKTNVKK